jgi:hypothetical protein
MMFLLVAILQGACGGGHYLQINIEIMKSLALN